MARAEVLELMKELRLIGMPVVYDEVLAQARKRRQSAEAMCSRHCSKPKRGSAVRARFVTAWVRAHFPLQCDLEELRVWRIPG